MPQTSALDQLLHVEAQLIAAFCWSVDSLSRSEMEGCQWLMGHILPDSLNTLHAMHTDQLDLMLQTSAFVQLLHTKAQLINAFCCSRQSYCSQLWMPASGRRLHLTKFLTICMRIHLIGRTFNVVMQPLSRPVRQCHDATAAMATATTIVYQMSLSIG